MYVQTLFVQTNTRYQPIFVRNALRGKNTTKCSIKHLFVLEIKVPAQYYTTEDERTAINSK